MKCIYCKKWAGFFKRQHPQCKINAENAKKYLSEWIDYAYNNRNCMNIEEIISNTVKTYNLPENKINDFFVECWKNKMHEASKDGCLDLSELNILLNMIQKLDIKQNENLIHSDEYWSLIKTGIQLYILAAIKTDDFSSLKEDIKLIGINEENKISIKKWAKEFVYNYMKENYRNLAKNGVVLDQDKIGDLYKLKNIPFELLNFSEYEIKEFDRRIYETAILNKLNKGILPENEERTKETEDETGISLQFDEFVVWSYNKINIYEYKLVRSEQKHRYVPAGYRGFLVITNKNLYYSSDEKNIKIPLKKIISLESCEEGFVVKKEGTKANNFLFEFDIKNGAAFYIVKKVIDLIK